MAPRIESAEILSFRLSLPREALPRLAHELRNEVPLTLIEDGQGIKLGLEDGECLLRFRARGDEAFLVEVAVSNDENGLFFNRAFGTLLAQHQGDLQAKVSWDGAPERNTHGTHALVVVHNGVTQSGARAANALRNTLVAAGDGGGAGEDGNPFGGPPAQGGNASASANANNAPPPTREEEELLAEVQQLLARGKAHWDEYQKLKSGK
jgi:hypothetical protein